MTLITKEKLNNDNKDLKSNNNNRNNDITLIIYINNII